MDTIQIFALIVLAMISIKLITIIIKPKAWLNLVDGVWKYPAITMIISLVLAVYVYIKLMNVITLTEFFATLLLVFLLSVFTLAVYVKEFTEMAHNLLKKGIMKKAWISILIWIILIILGFKEILG